VRNDGRAGVLNVSGDSDLQRFFSQPAIDLSLDTLNVYIDSLFDVAAKSHVRTFIAPSQLRCA
jgi:hypothetical protein